MSTKPRDPVVVLGVTGCIAAYKACDLARDLMRAGCTVKVVMTEAATRFVGPATFRALTGQPVATTLWDDPGSKRVFHVSLAEEADVVVIAPATANTIAKVAQGRADDLLTTTVLASHAPLVVAPAMNTRMWRAEATVESVATLRKRGAVIVEPATGELACGDVGEGRLADVSEIASAVLAEATRSRDLEGVSVLVTAGGTREPIDPVRYIGNRSSGITGYAIAGEAARRGAAVTLVSGPATLPAPFGCDVVRVETAAEMSAAVRAAYPSADVVVAVAAVADVRPSEVAGSKLRKQEIPHALQLERTEDILAMLGRDKGGRVLIGFAAETGEEIAGAQTKLAAKNLDMVVANDVSVPGLGFGSAVNKVTFVTSAGAEEMRVRPKAAIACELWDRVAPAARDAAAARHDGDQGTHVTDATAREEG